MSAEVDVLTFLVRFAFLLALIIPSGCGASATIINVRDKGAVGNGATDDTGAFNDAIAACNNGTVYVPAGVYLCNAVVGPGQRCNIKGDGPGTSTLISYTSNGAALTLQDRDSLWMTRSINGIYFSRGTTTDARIGVRFGGDTYASGDELTGRYVFRDCNFNCAVGVLKQDGNIGNRFDACSFLCNSYAYYAYNRTTVPMHIGCDTFTGCHFQAAQSAAVYLDSPRYNTGATAFEHCVFESNPGYAIYANSYVSGWVPGLVISDTWLEANASGSVAPVSTAGPFGTTTSLAPVELYFTNASATLVRCQPASVTLNSSAVKAKECKTDATTLAVDQLSVWITTP